MKNCVNDCQYLSTTFKLDCLVYLLVGLVLCLMFYSIYLLVDALAAFNNLMSR